MFQPYYVGKIFAIAIGIIGFVYLLGVYSFFEGRKKDDEK